MLVIAISLLFGGLAALAFWTIATSLEQGFGIGRAIAAELACMEQGPGAPAPTFRPLRGRVTVNQQSHSRQAVRLRPMRQTCAAA